MLCSHRVAMRVAVCQVVPCIARTHDNVMAPQGGAAGAQCNLRAWCAPTTIPPGRRLVGRAAGGGCPRAVRNVWRQLAVRVPYVGVALRRTAQSARTVLAASMVCGRAALFGMSRIVVRSNYVMRVTHILKCAINLRSECAINVPSLASRKL